MGNSFFNKTICHATQRLNPRESHQHQLSNQLKLQVENSPAPWMDTRRCPRKFLSSSSSSPPSLLRLSRPCFQLTSKLLSAMVTISSWEWVHGWDMLSLPFTSSPSNTISVKKSVMPLVTDMKSLMDSRFSLTSPRNQTPPRRHEHDDEYQLLKF